MAAHTYNLSICGIEAGVTEAQSNPWLQGKFEARVDKLVSKITTKQNPWTSVPPAIEVPGTSLEAVLQLTILAPFGHP